MAMTLAGRGSQGSVVNVDWAAYVCQGGRGAGGDVTGVLVDRASDRDLGLGKVANREVRGWFRLVHQADRFRESKEGEGRRQQGEAVQAGRRGGRRGGGYGDGT